MADDFLCRANWHRRFVANLAKPDKGFTTTLKCAAVRPVLDLQAAWSHLPGEHQLLLEQCQVREGFQWFVFPFEGRSVNEGLAALIAHRITRITPCSITLTPNDYGFELLSNRPLDFDESACARLLSTSNLLDDLLGCLNGTELARRQFRDIARVAGLIFPGYPGAPRSARQLQASSGLLYDVFREYDAQNLLLEQSRREVLERQLASSQLTRAMSRIAEMELLLQRTPRLTPLSFPLWAARIQTTHLSSESWMTRVTRMIAQLEQAAVGSPAAAKVAQPGASNKARQRPSRRRARMPR